MKVMSQLRPINRTIKRIVKMIIIGITAMSVIIFCCGGNSNDRH